MSTEDTARDPIPLSNPPAPAKAAPLGLLAAVLLISCAAIAYEILLMRVLSIVQWHHFAWMIISLALLGYGASGSAIAPMSSHSRKFSFAKRV